MKLLASVRSHWPEYLMEAWALGTFMLSAGTFAVLMEAPGSALRGLIQEADLRQAMTGVAMGLTAMAIIYSPWGKRSGAHMNPAVTLTFLTLGRVALADALFYMLAQILGGLTGVLVVQGLFGESFTDPPVSWAQTLPGATGNALAFTLECAMAFGLMTLILFFSNHVRLAPLTGVAAGITVATYIAFEAPFSGMSINPARTLASAIPAGGFDHLWLYLIAPPVGMLLAATVHYRRGSVSCAKLIHTSRERCIHCGYEPTRIGTVITQSSSGGSTS